MKNKLFALLILCGNAFASDSWYSRHAEGWFWYKDDVVQQSNEGELREQGESSKSSPTYYTDKLKNIEVRNKELLSRLVVEPTEQNLKEYAEALNDAWNNYGKIRQVNKMVMINNPHLDVDVKYPRGQDAVMVTHQMEKEQIEAKVKSLVGNYGLVFFIAGGCKYCEIFEPTVKQFVDKHGFSILPVLMGKDSFSLFDYVGDNGISRYMKVTYYPSLYLLEYATQKFYPIAHGATSLEELEKNASIYAR